MGERSTYQPPSLINNIGQVIRVMNGGCDIPPSLWVETGISAIISAFVTFAGPDWRYAFHEATGHSITCFAKEGLADVKEIAPEAGSGLTRFLFKLTEKADAAVWFLYLGSIAREGLIDWTSQAMRLAGCVHPNSQNGSDDAFGSVPDETLIGGRNGYAWFTGEGSIGPIIHPVLVIPPRHRGQIGFHAVGLYPPNTPIGLVADIVDVNSGAVYDHHESSVTDEGPRKTMVFSSIKNDDDQKSIILQVLANGIGETPQHVVYFGGGHLFMNTW